MDLEKLLSLLGSQISQILPVLRQDNTSKDLMNTMACCRIIYMHMCIFKHMNIPGSESLDKVIGRSPVLLEPLLNSDLYMKTIDGKSSNYEGGLELVKVSISHLVATFLMVGFFHT